jgi:hypothetical protein
MLRPGKLILYSPQDDGPPLGLLSFGFELSAGRLALGEVRS